MVKSSPLFKSYGRDAVEWYVLGENSHDTSPSPYEIAKYYNGALKIGALKIPNNLSLRSYPVSWEDAIPVFSVEEAEQLFLSRFSNIEDVEFHHNARCCGMTPQSVTIILNRKMNLIASNTRRGVGNVIIVGNTVLQYINSSHGVFQPTVGVTTEDSQWKKVGIFNKHSVVYTNGAIPDDEAIVAYIGLPDDQIIDAPAALLVDNDEMRLYFKKTLPLAFASADDYISRFRMKII